MQQADDFEAESAALFTIVQPLDGSVFQTPTQFKEWTVNEVIQHLHFFNLMADYSATQPDRFKSEYAALQELRDGGDSLVSATNKRLEGLSDGDLVSAWRQGYLDLSAKFRGLDPKSRLEWVGPSMSARSSITARLMETWAHGQEIYDLVGLDRPAHDRIRNVAHLGVSTFGWTFVNRGEPVPERVPYVRLNAPSGAIWEWGEAANDERVAGSAIEFCQVVAQTRNVVDTGLQVTGTVASRWMAVAQCFAGPPQMPPVPGTRHRA